MPAPSCIIVCNLTTKGKTRRQVNSGDLLGDGKYRVERVLGAGGMGIVVEATHLDLEQRVALKLVLNASDQDDEATRRLLREAQAAASHER